MCDIVGMNDVNDKNLYEPTASSEKCDYSTSVGLILAFRQC